MKHQILDSWKLSAIIGKTSTTSVKFLTCLYPYLKIITPTYVERSSFGNEWTISTIHHILCSIGPDGRIERHNPPLNGSSIDNIAEGVQGLCGKVNYSPLGKKQPHNLPYKLPTQTVLHHTLRNILVEILSRNIFS